MDIYLNIERKWNNEWQLVRDYNAVPHGRGYRIYDLLTGMIGYDEVISFCKPRGVPKDASAPYKSQVHDHGGYYHTHSYITLDEFEMFHWDKMVYEGDFADTYKRMANWLYDIVIPMMRFESSTRCRTDVRLLFYFSEAYRNWTDGFEPKSSYFLKKTKKLRIPILDGPRADCG